MFWIIILTFACPPHIEVLLLFYEMFFLYTCLQNVITKSLKQCSKTNTIWWIHFWLLNLILLCPSNWITCEEKYFLSKHHYISIFMWCRLLCNFFSPPPLRKLHGEVGESHHVLCCQRVCCCRGAVTAQTELHSALSTQHHVWCRGTVTMKTLRWNPLVRSSCKKQLHSPSRMTNIGIVSWQPMFLFGRDGEIVLPCVDYDPICAFETNVEK